MAGQPSAKGSAPAPRRLLIIDDDETLLEALAGIFPLRLPSVIVQTTQSAHAGLQLLQAEHYDLILCDVRMPGKDGLAFLQELARVPFSPPVVMMTAHGDHHSFAQAQRHGAIAFIEKPFEREELVTTVVRLLGL